MLIRVHTIQLVDRLVYTSANDGTVRVWRGNESVAVLHTARTLNGPIDVSCGVVHCVTYSRHDCFVETLAPVSGASLLYPIHPLLNRTNKSWAYIFFLYFHSNEDRDARDLQRW